MLRHFYSKAFGTIRAISLDSLCGLIALVPFYNVAVISAVRAQSIPTVQRKKVPPEGTTWRLTEWQFNGQNISLLPQRPITIQFDGKRLGGSTGCNSYGADYRRQNAQLQLVGSVVSTRIACQLEIAEREQQYLTALNANEKTIHGTENCLTIRYTTAAGNGVLVFGPH